MIHRDNYRIQAEQAKQRFLTYDHEKLVEKFRMKADENYLYPVMLGRQYRLSRTDGNLEACLEGRWEERNSFGEVMTLLDLLCDSRQDRWISGQWKSMESFGLMFHRNLLEGQADSFTKTIDREPERLHRACAALGAQKIPGGDYGYAVELFDGLKIGILFWHGDEEFEPRLRWLWDANAGMYLRYETMHYALGLVKSRLREAGI